MEFSAAFLLALRALGRNKMRSSLTMLGMIIGVGAVIAVIGIGQGAAAKAQEQLAALGSNMLMVGSGSVNRGGLHTGHGQTKTLVIADARAIVRECPSVSAAASGTGTRTTDRVREPELGHADQRHRATVFWGEKLAFRKWHVIQ